MNVPSFDSANSLTILDTSHSAKWDEIRERFAPHGSRSFDRVIDVAQALGVRTVIIERDYWDPDYSSQFAAFYSRQYRVYRHRCERLHFFSREVDQWDSLERENDEYCGYCVIRPVADAPVGRTMIRPPRPVTSVCLAAEVVEIFGSRLMVRAAAFMGEDLHFQTCAHAAQWMVLYHNHLVHSGERCLPHQVQAASASTPVEMHGPSIGLTIEQMVEGFERLGMRGSLAPWSDQVDDDAETYGWPYIQRYLDSEFPSIALTSTHATVVVGCDNDGTLIVHDPELGPYLEVSDTSSWEYTLPVVPSSIVCGASEADLIGRLALRGFDSSENGPQTLNALRPEFLAYVVAGDQYKFEVQYRAPERVARTYRLIPLPRFIWVVEAFDPSRGSRKPSVLGEVLIDATASHRGLPTATLPESVLAIHWIGASLVRLANGDGFHIERGHPPDSPEQARGDVTHYWSGAPGRVTRRAE